MKFHAFNVSGFGFSMAVDPEAKTTVPESL